MHEVVIVGTKRTPIGDFLGSLRTVSPNSLPLTGN